MSDQEPDDRVAARPALLYTSGTTGRPKGVELRFHARGLLPINAHVEQLRTIPFSQNGKHLIVGPLYHGGPQSGIWALAVGTSVVLLDRFDPEKTLAAIEQFHIGSSVMVPTHFYRLVNLPAEVKAQYDLSSLRFVSHTGSGCPAWLKRQMIAWWGPVIVEAYGGTEAGTISRITSADWLAHPGSVGRPMAPYMRAFAADAHGNELPSGTEGVLYFVDETGRGVIYRGNPEATAKAHTAPGIFTLGDVGVVDDEGYIFVTGRETDMIISGGVNIYPAESEAVLLRHPRIMDAAVFGVPDDEMGEIAQAFVVIVPDSPAVAPDDILRYCRERLSHVKCPKAVTIVDTLDRTQMGKVNKKKLRLRYEQEIASQ